MKKYQIYILVIALALCGLIFLVTQKNLPLATTYSSQDKLEEEISASLEDYNLNIKNYPQSLTITGTSGNFVRFSTAPKPGVDVDSAFGFAEKKSGQWQILMYGTGGDPTEFYRKYNIPNELRDEGFVE